MQLHLNKTSPYARVARITALELGLDNQLTLCWSDPWTDEPALVAVNPASRVPTLITDQGIAISESLLIAQYLDSLDGQGRLLPATNLAEVLHKAGLGQGLIDAAFNTVIARKYLGEDADESVLGQRRLRAIIRSLSTLERMFGAPTATRIDLGDIVIGVALAYLDFRLAEIDWQATCPALADYQARLLERDSFIQTGFN